MYELNRALNTDVKSLAFVTMHKAGSSIAGRILTVYAEKAGYTPANLAEVAKATGALEGEFCIANAPLLGKRGYYFGPFRGVYVQHMGGFIQNRLIVQIRDPRDCLCSYYFSLGWGHVLPPKPGPRKRFLERRQSVQSQTIDEYVMGAAHEYLARLCIIKKILDNHDDCLLLKYEDMVTDTESWRRQIESFLRVKRDAALDEELARYIDFSVKGGEDPSRHKRQVMPGDYRRKLKPETIANINDRLAPVLRAFAYEF